MSKDFDNRHDDIGYKMVKACASGLCHNNNKKQPDKVFALFVQTEGQKSDLGTIFILRKHCSQNLLQARSQDIAASVTILAG